MVRLYETETLYNQYSNVKENLRTFSNPDKSNAQETLQEYKDVDQNKSISGVVSDVEKEIQQVKNELKCIKNSLYESIQMSGLRRGREVALKTHITNLMDRWNILETMYIKKTNAKLDTIVNLKEKLTSFEVKHANIDRTVMLLIELQSKAFSSLKDFCVEIEMNRRHLRHEFELTREVVTSLQFDMKKFEEDNDLLVKGHEMKVQSMEDERRSLESAFSIEKEKLINYNGILKHEVDSRNKSLSILQCNLAKEQESNNLLSKNHDIIVNEQRNIMARELELQQKLMEISVEKDQTLNELHEAEEKYNFTRMIELEKIEARVKVILVKKSEEVRSALNRARKAEEKVRQMEEVLEDLDVRLRS